MPCVPDQLFCAIRQEWVKALPEEKVRQQWIHILTSQLKYPSEGFALEKELRQIPHLSLYPGRLPSRRADLIFFAKRVKDNSLSPLILIECKAIKLNQKAIRQAVGYNFYLKAPYIALVNQDEALWGKFDPIKQEFCFEKGFPSYEILTNSQQR